jgi:hypothetical protein
MTIDAVCAAALSANKCDCGRPPRQLEGRALSRPIFLGHDGACPSPAIMGKGLGVLLRFACFCHVERSATKSRHRLLLIPRQKFLHFGRHDKAESGRRQSPVKIRKRSARVPRRNSFCSLTAGYGHHGPPLRSDRSRHAQVRNRRRIETRDR